MVNGRLVVLTGPSGVGKGTLLKFLLQRHPELNLSISMTTRSPRPGEIDGQDYVFTHRDRFLELVAQGEFLEWAEFAGNCYGTPRKPVDDWIKQGKSVILEIELQGARQIRQSYADAFQIFLLPPSLEELERRLRRRGHDSDAAIAKRLKQAETEISAVDEFDVCVVNDDLEKALAAIESTLFSLSHS
jgi:guanylate kinase